MKKTIIVVALLIALSSCKHCYQCTYSQHTIIAPQVSGQITYVSSEFCGTKIIMKKGTENFKKIISDHLQVVASNDELFAKNLAKENKSIDQLKTKQ